IPSTRITRGTPPSSTTWIVSPSTTLVTFAAKARCLAGADDERRPSASTLPASGPPTPIASRAQTRRTIARRRGARWGTIRGRPRRRARHCQASGRQLQRKRAQVDDVFPGEKRGAGDAGPGHAGILSQPERARDVLRDVARDGEQLLGAE